jgi:formylglycine-generating enzyme required for sulfatase activity
MWAGKALPSDAQWEYAARGGLEGAVFAWGDEQGPDGELMANFWQGDFPWRSSGARGWRGTSPVGLFPANGYGLFDMTGNVWEWTTDYYSPHGAGSDGMQRSCCGPPINPRIATLTRATTSGVRANTFPGGWSRAARTSAHRAIACATGLRPANPRRPTPPPATSASAASRDKNDNCVSLPTVLSLRPT